MRLIDADEFRREMYHEAFETDSDLQKWDSGCWIRYKMFENAIENFPAVDAVPVVHGKWVFNENDDMFYCTNCKNGSVRNDYPYCHWCGAKMDREKVTE